VQTNTNPEIHEQRLEKTFDGPNSDRSKLAEANESETDGSLLRTSFTQSTITDAITADGFEEDNDNSEPISKS
jgi:hypothetical protein